MMAEETEGLGDLDIEAPAIEPSMPEPTEAPVEGLEPVEGLVNKETMTRSRDEVDHDPEVVEDAARLTSEEVGGDTMPWEGLTDLEDLEVETGGASEEGEADPFSDSLAEGMVSDVSDREDAVDFDLKEMEDWTPGYLHEKDLTAERGEELGAEALLDEGGEFSIDFGDEVAATEEDVESDTEPGVVTETMAELYAKQGLYDDALGVYRRLAQERPDDERLQGKIAELEERLEESAGKHAAGFELSELLELTEPRVPAEFASDTTTPVDAEPAAEPPEMMPAPVEPAAEPPDTTPAPPEAAPPEFLGVEQEAAEVELASGPEPQSEADAPLAAPSMTGSGEFSFEDEAPVAGIEQLDPFASSFDVFVQRDGAADAPEPAELETTSPGFEGPVPVTVEGVPLVSPDPDLVPPGAYIEPPPPTPPPPSRRPPVEHTAPEPAVEPARPVSAPPGSLTIEDYLAGLLAYQPGTPRAEVAAPAQEAVAEPAPEPQPSTTSELSPSTGGADDDDDDEDLEQFQEWLRGLKT
jgi:hypothetical protein